MGSKRLDHVNFITHQPEATVYFYCDVIGLVLGSSLSIDTSKSIYFYIPGQDVAILHVGNAKSDKKQPKFERMAELDSNHQNDYDAFIDKLKREKLAYKTYCHE
ncbi:MAG: VOC family protein, partial [Legionellaceae bacterium]|nr:VOC family protein [Legionellaceae bacterium]